MYVLDPLHYFVVCESAPDVMQRIALANPDAPLPTAGATSPAQQTGRIILPDSMVTDGMPADGGARGRGGAILTLMAGRVLWAGPGKQWEGAFVVPKVSRGDVVLFSPRTVSYEFTLHGRSIKIVPYSEIAAKVREVAVTDAEWTELPRPSSEILAELRAQQLLP